MPIWSGPWRAHTTGRPRARGAFRVWARTRDCTRIRGALHYRILTALRGLRLRGLWLLARPTLCGDASGLRLGLACSSQHASLTSHVILLQGPGGTPSVYSYNPSFCSWRYLIVIAVTSIGRPLHDAIRMWLLPKQNQESYYMPFNASMHMMVPCDAGVFI